MVTKKIYYIAGAAVALLILTKKTKAFTAIVSLMRYRGQDQYGNGAFAASRSGGTRDHAGVDILAIPGQAILSPITGTVTRIAYPYATDLSYKGLEIVNEAYKVKIFYINPAIAIGSKVTGGQKIAVAQNISAKYGASMQNHVHFEAYDKNGNLLNPTNMFK